MVHNFHQICHRWVRIQPSAETRLFCFKADENGDEYVTLSHKKKTKRPRKVVLTTENPKEKRMYAVSSAGEKCPLRTLNLLLSKSDQNAEFMFNRCIKPTLSSLETVKIWYDNVPLKLYQYTRFMADIAKHLNCASRKVQPAVYELRLFRA